MQPSRNEDQETGMRSSEACPISVYETGMRSSEACPIRAYEGPKNRGHTLRLLPGCHKHFLHHTAPPTWGAALPQAQSIKPSNRRLKPLSLWAQTNLSTSTWIISGILSPCLLPTWPYPQFTNTMLNKSFIKNHQKVCRETAPSLIHHFCLDSSSISRYCQDL